jgi:hypothetical protein
MNPFRQTEAIATAYKMKREMLAGLQAQLRIQQELLLATQKEINELQWLNGENLVRVMSGLEESEVLKHQQDWITELREIITGGWDMELEEAA